jgi:hypothetical protein
LLSDGLYRRFATQLAIRKQQGVRDALADHAIWRAQLHAVEQDAHFDTLHVALEGTSRDAEVSAALSYEEATARAATAKPEPYTEIWSFLRRPGAKTLAGDGALGGACPNCGAVVPQSFLRRTSQLVRQRVLNRIIRPDPRTPPAL